MIFEDTKYLIMGRLDLEFYEDGETIEFGDAVGFTTKEWAEKELSAYDEPSEFFICKVESTHRVTRV